MPPNSVSRRWWVVDPVCALIFLACVVGHLLHLRNGEALQMADSSVYTRQAEHPLTDSRFWIRKAPPLYPLWYKAFGAFGDTELIAGGVHPRTEPVLPAAQTALSLLAFTMLAFACARTAYTRAGRRLLFALPLAVSLMPLVAKWNQVVMSESLSMSLFAIFVAAWFLYFRRPSWWALAAIATSAVLWATVRDTNYLTVAMIVPIAALADVGGRRKSAALCIALIAAFAVAHAVESRSDRRLFSFYNVVGQRILPHPDRVGFFASSGGMPTSSALAERSGKWASDDELAFFGDMRLERFREWSADHGVATYVQFLLAHPFYSLAAPATEIGETFLNRLGWAVNMDWSSPDEPLAPWLAGALRWAVLLGYGAAILSALSLWRRGRLDDAPWLLVPLGMALLSLPQLWVAWLGDAMGYLRHGLTAVLCFLLGGLLLSAAMVDKFLAQVNTETRVRDLSETPDGCAHRMGAKHRWGASFASLLAVATCLIVASLTKPGYVNRGESLYRRLEGRPPLQVASGWNIHAIADDPNDTVGEVGGGGGAGGKGWTIVYSKTPCTWTDLDASFFLHVWAEDSADLPLHRAAAGYDNLDFSCTAYRCWLLDEGIDKRCVATARLPAYRIDQAFTGQFRTIDESLQNIWAGEKFTLPADTPRTE